MKTWASQIRAGNGKPSRAHSRPGSGMVEPPHHWSLSSQAFLQMVSCPEAARTCKAPPIRSSLSGHRDPATPGRRLKCAMVTLRLLKIGQREFSDGVREHIAGVAIRSAHDKRMALKLLSLVSSARLALSRKKSSSLGMCVDPAPFPAMSLANVARHLPPAMRYLKFNFKRVLRITDLRGHNRRQGKPHCSRQ